MFFYDEAVIYSRKNFPWGQRRGNCLELREYPSSKISPKKNTGTKTFTNVFKFFLTLSNVDRNDPSLTLERATKKIQEMVGPNTKVLGVKEYHRTSGYHFHFLILSQGIRKNTYKEDFRNLFSIFPGMTLDVQGVKSFRAAVDYILKQVRVPELFALHIGTGTGENIYSTEPIVFWLSPIQKKALVMLGDIRKFESYDDFITRNIEYAMLHGNKKAYITSI